MIQSMKKIFRLRRRLLDGAIQDIRYRYVGSLFGMAWAIIYPLLQLSVYAGLYAFIFKVRPSGLTEADYVILVFSGLVPLMAFNEIIIASTNSLTANKSLLLNTVFPAELIPLRAALAAQVPTLSGLTITMLAGFLVGNTGWQAVLLVPVVWLFLIMFAVGIGYILSLLSLVVRDIQHGLGIILMTLTILSPFAYTPEMVPAALKPIIFLNPLSYFVMTFQSLICFGTWPEWNIVMVAIILGVALFMLGISIFVKAKRFFFDYV